MRIDSFLYLYPEKPVLVPPTSSLIDRLSEDPRWVAQPKFNGNRLQLHIINGKWELWNRHGQRIKAKQEAELNTELDKLAGSLKGYWLMDGELRDRKVKGIRSRIVLWDTFIAEGEMLNNKRYYDRIRLLDAIGLASTEPLGARNSAELRRWNMEPVEENLIGVIFEYYDDFRSVFSDITVNPEIEGLVMKNTDGMLNLSRTSNQDSAWMYKLRRPNNSYRY